MFIARPPRVNILKDSVAGKIGCEKGVGSKSKGFRPSRPQGCSVPRGGNKISDGLTVVRAGRLRLAGKSIFTAVRAGVAAFPTCSV